MHAELLEILRCPQSGQRLRLESPSYRNDEIVSAELVSEDDRYHYPVRNSIPRFVPESNYADNFGMQWNTFRQTQLDSYSGQPISAERFWRATGWRPADLNGKWVFDAGCGAGRFAEVALLAGAKVVALDYSSAVEAARTNLERFPNVHVIQGDIYSLPLARAFFPFIYSLCVLQHTPDVGRAFACLPPHACAGGRICVDVYWKRIRTMLHTKYLLRPFTKRMSKQSLFRALEKHVPRMLPMSQSAHRIPFVGRLLARAVPVADYTGRYPLNAQQLREWALLDTFDMLAPEYDNPQTSTTLRRWLRDAGLEQAEVFQEGHLVGRGVVAHDRRY